MPDGQNIPLGQYLFPEEFCTVFKVHLYGGFRETVASLCHRKLLFISDFIPYSDMCHHAPTLG